MCPVSESDGHDAPGLINELVPGVAAVVDNVLMRLEHTVGQPVVAHELPDVLDRVQFRRLRRQRHQGDVRRHCQPGRHVPSGLVQQQHGMPAGFHRAGQLGKVQAHRLDVAARQYKPGRLAQPGADRTEDVAGRGPLILGCRRPATPQSPAPGDGVLLAHTGLIGEPDLYVGQVDAFTARERCQAGSKRFLKSSIAPASCIW
jgi:hypothetical protein